MNSYIFEMDFEAEVPDVKYNEMDYDNFKLREIFVDGKSDLEFHFGFKDKSMNTLNNMNNIKHRLGVRDIRFVDPMNELELEYPIYIKLSTLYKIPGSIDGALTSLDDEITKFKERG